MQDQDELNKLKDIESGIDSVVTELQALAKSLKQPASRKKDPLLTVPSNFMKELQASTVSLKGFNKFLEALAANKPAKPTSVDKKPADTDKKVEEPNKKLKEGLAKIVETFTAKSGDMYKFLEKTSKTLNKEGDFYKLFEKQFANTEKEKAVRKSPKSKPITQAAQALAQFKNVAKKDQPVVPIEKPKGIIEALKVSPERAKKRQEMILPMAILDALKEKKEKLFPSAAVQAKKQKETPPPVETKSQDTSTDVALKEQVIQPVNLVEIAPKVIKQLQEVFGKTTGKSKAGDSFSALGKNIGGGLESLAAGIGKAIELVAKGAGKGMEFIGKGLAALGKGAGMGIAAVGKGVAGAISAIALALPELAVGLAALANPLTLVGLAAVTLALIGIGKALQLAAPFVQAIMPLFVKMAEVIGNVLVKQLDILKDILVEIIDVFGTVLIEGLSKASEIITAIAEGISTVMNTVAGVVETAIDTVIIGITQLSELDGANLYKVAGGIIAISAALATFSVGAAAAGVGTLVGGLLGKVTGQKSPLDSLIEFGKNSEGLVKGADAIKILADSLKLFESIDASKLSKILSLDFKKLAIGATMAATMTTASPAAPTTQTAEPMTQTAGSVAGAVKPTETITAPKDSPIKQTKKTTQTLIAGEPIIEEKSLSPKQLQAKKMAEGMGHEYNRSREIVKVKPRINSVLGQQMADRANEDRALAARVGDTHGKFVPVPSRKEVKKIEDENKSNANKVQTELTKVQGSTEKPITLATTYKPVIDSNDRLISKLETLIKSIQPIAGLQSTTNASATTLATASNATTNIYPADAERDIPYVERNKYRQQLLYTRGLM
jgi:hypothetical protein